MSAEIKKEFTYHPEVVDLERLILTKQEFADWAGIDRHRFRYYIKRALLSRKEREGIQRGLQQHITRCAGLIMLLNDE